MKKKKYLRRMEAWMYRYTTVTVNLQLQLAKLTAALERTEGGADAS